MGLKLVDDPDTLRALEALDAQQAGGSKAGHYASLAGRGATEGAVSGVAGLPALVGDSFLGVGRDIAYLGHKGLSKLGVVDAPNPASYYDESKSSFPLSGAVDAVGKGAADTLGFDNPETAGERVFTNAVAGGVGGLSGAGLAGGAAKLGRSVGMTALPAAADFLAAGKTAQTVGGAAGGALSQAVSEGGGSQGQQIVAGMLGGGLGGLAVPAVAKAGRTVLDATVPLRQAGHEDIVGQLLNQHATDPAAAAAAMANGGPSRIPGVEHPIGSASRDPGLASLEQGVKNGLDSSGQISKRILDNNTARNVFLDAEQGTDPATLAQARQTTMDPIRQAAFTNAQPADVSPILSAMGRIASSPQAARSGVQQALNFVGSKLTGMQMDPQVLYAIRQDIGDAIAGRFGGDLNGMKLARKELLHIRSALDDSVDAATDGQFKPYLQQFRLMSQDIDNAQTMRDVRKAGGLSQPDINSGYDIFSPAKLKTAIQSRADDFNKLQPFQKEALNKVLGDVQEANFASTPGIRPTGSDTMRNLSVASAFGRVMGAGSMDNTTLRALAKPLGWLYSAAGSDAKLHEMLVDVMLDPQRASVLMQKATPRNMAKLSDALKVAAQRTGMGAARGASNSEPYMGGDYVLSGGAPGR